MSIGLPQPSVPDSEEEMTECRAEMVLKEASEPWEPRLEFSPGLAGAAGQRVHLQGHGPPAWPGGSSTTLSSHSVSSCCRRWMRRSRRR